MLGAVQLSSKALSPKKPKKPDADVVVGWRRNQLPQLEIGGIGGGWR